MSPRTKRALAFGLVSAQLVLLAGLVLVPRGSLWARNSLVALFALVLGVAGVFVAALGAIGLGPALRASPIPREQAPLVTRGIYGIVRNPIYTGLMVGGLGLVLFGASVWHVALWFALLLVLAGKARWEERMLIARHPDYRGYASRVGRFVPGVGRLRPPE